METFGRRRWTTIPTGPISKLLSPWRWVFLVSAVKTSFLNLIYHGASMVVNLLLLKFSMNLVIALYALSPWFCYFTNTIVRLPLGPSSPSTKDLDGWGCVRSTIFFCFRPYSFNQKLDNVYFNSYHWFFSPTILQVQVWIHTSHSGGQL